jgi:hypothetical protein
VMIISTAVSFLSELGNLIFGGESGVKGECDYIKTA